MTRRALIETDDGDRLHDMARKDETLLGKRRLGLQVARTSI